MSSLASRIFWWCSDAWTIMLRHLRRLPRQPDMVTFAVIQPIMFILLFRYVFGGAIEQSLSGESYSQFLMPGIFVQTVAFSSVGSTGIGMAIDMKNGLMDRFRSLPMSRTSVLLGKALSDIVLNAITVLTMVLIGLAVGFRFEGSFLGAVAGIVVLLLFGFAFSWIAMFIGLSISVEAAQSAGFMWLFPLTFASSAFVPTKDMPSWLRSFANNNPVTIVIDALRSWFNGSPVGSDGWLSLMWCAIVMAVFLPLSVWRYRRAT